jgi:hypothetical protein
MNPSIKANSVNYSIEKTSGKTKQGSGRARKGRDNFLAEVL